MLLTLSQRDLLFLVEAFCDQKSSCLQNGIFGFAILYNDESLIEASFRINLQTAFVLQSHFSIKKAAVLLGIGLEHVFSIPADKRCVQ